MTVPRIKVLEPPTPPEPSLVEPNLETPVIPPISTEPPTDPPTEDKRDQLIETQMAVIRELSQGQQKLQDQINNLNKPPIPITPEPTVAEKDKRFWESPSAMIKEEMKTAVEPLYDFVSEMKSGSNYDRAKALLRDDPKFGPVLAKAEGYVDELMKGQDPTIANLKAVIYGVRGAAELGELPGLSFKEQAAAAATDLGIIPDPSVEPVVEPVVERKLDMSTVPAHLRPSPPTPPKPGEKKRIIDPNSFTENERRLARERNMSLEDYAAWRDTPADQVITTELGKEK